ncbi:unnamed protein product [Orchesella dallaii]|uniref:Uncharacterized protein n=1 Tax=Orchesella dallaii TaxID=48710 RepID=A0ABP1QHU8_9HEXA
MAVKTYFVIAMFVVMAAWCVVSATVESQRNIHPKFFNNVFNLSAYLANAPTNQAALNVVPLGALLFSG